MIKRKACRGKNITNKIFKMFQIEYSKSSIFECGCCMEMILVGYIKLGEEKAVFV